MKVDAPFVSVVIPVLNQHDSLRRCLAALERQTYPRQRMEFIVVDNGSSSATGDIPGAVLLGEAVPGAYAARNRGIEQARGEVLAFTDADCMPASTWIEQGVTALRALGPLGMIAGRIDLAYQDPLNLTAAELFESVCGFPQEQYVKWGFGATANLFTTSETMRRVGRFNPDLLSGGDREWGQRVRAQGLPQRYDDDVRVVHPARHHPGELLRKARRVAGGVQTIATMHGKGLSSILRQAHTNLVLLRRIRASLPHAQLNTMGRKVRFAIMAWATDLFHSGERLRIYFGGTPRRA